MSMVKGIIGVSAALIGALFVAGKYADKKYAEGYVQGRMDENKEWKLNEMKNDATDKLFDLINQMKKEKIVVKQTIDNVEKLKYMALVKQYGMDEAVKIVWKNINNNKG